MTTTKAMWVNLTNTLAHLPSGHDVQPSGMVADVVDRYAPAGRSDGVNRSYYHAPEVQNLPAPEPGVNFLVFARVREAVPERVDLYSLEQGPSGPVLVTNGPRF